MLCTFTTRPTLDLTVDYLDSFFDIYQGQLFLYQDLEDSYNLMLIYNVDNFDTEYFAKNTIPVHRKQYTNTYYTINALNNLIRRVNNGLLDTNFQINWENYENTIMTGKKDELNITEIIFEKKINLNRN